MKILNLFILERNSSLKIVNFLENIKYYIHMKISYIKNIIIFLSLFPLTVNSQEKKESRLWDRMYVGGNFGLQFGTLTDIEVSPHLGYYIYPRWSAGFGITYEYYNKKASYYNPFVIKTHMYGWNLFTTVDLIPDLGKIFRAGSGVAILGHAEYERLSLERIYFEYPYNNTGRFWMDSFLVGGGIKQAIGKRSSIYIMVLWNINETINSPYSNPILKFGFNF